MTTLERKLEMYIKDMRNSIAEYHEFLQTQGNCTLFQTPEWGEVKTRGEWSNDILFVMNDQDEPVAATMILYRALPVVKRYLAYAPRGIVTNYHNAEQFKEVIQALKTYLKQKRVFGLKIDPEIMWRERLNDFSIVEGGINQEVIRQLLLESGFVSQPLDLGFGGIQPRMTMIVELEDKGKDILDTFTSKERYKVTMAQKRGVVCYKGSIEDIDDYEVLNRITAERDQYIARSKEYLITIYETLHAHDMMDLFFAKIDYHIAKESTENRIHQAKAAVEKIASQVESTQNEKKKTNLLNQRESLLKNIKKYKQEVIELEALCEEYPNGKVLSGAFVATYKDTAYYLYGANITDDAGLHSNKLLQTWIMQTLYNEKGIRHYDMFGVSSNVEDHTGITQFKQSFDPKLVEYIGEFDMPISKFWFELFHTWAPKAVSLKNKLLVRRKK